MLFCLFTLLSLAISNELIKKGDGVCDTTNGQKEITDEHTAYQGSKVMQDLGADFVIKALNPATGSITSAVSTGSSIESASASNPAPSSTNETESAITPLSSDTARVNHVDQCCYSGP
jgi:hypothetical protein